jgi:hypothetical protein
MEYVLPKDVHSPKLHWRLVEVIIDEGAGMPAYALGTWDGERRIGFRWNGTKDNKLGNPQSRGLATWTMLDTKLHSAVIAIAASEKQAIISAFLMLKPRVELIGRVDASGTYTLEEVIDGGELVGLRASQIFITTYEAEFYKNAAWELSSRRLAGQFANFVDLTSLGSSAD